MSFFACSDPRATVDQPGTADLTIGHKNNHCQQKTTYCSSQTLVNYL